MLPTSDRVAEGLHQQWLWEAVRGVDQVEQYIARCMKLPGLAHLQKQRKKQAKAKVKSKETEPEMEIDG